MNFEFVLDENYLAFFILYKKMYNESEEITNIKNKLYSEHNLGYKKILEEELIDFSIYLKHENIKKLIYEFIQSNEFNEIYRTYENMPKEEIAIKILKNMILPDNNNLDTIKNELWFKHMKGYRILINMNFLNIPILLLDKDIKKIIQSLKETDEFKKLYKETEVYLFNVKKCWKEKENSINKYLKQILKIDFHINPTVYISHPNTYEGYSFANDKIAWGHYFGISEPNYNLTYLVHEGLHCLIPFEDSDTEISASIKHAIIELIADYELYSSLKGKSTLKEGHQELQEFRMFIYPYWLKYIGLDDYQIIKRLEKDLIDLNVFHNIENIELSYMNIYEFMDFCNQSYLKSIKKR